MMEYRFNTLVDNNSKLITKQYDSDQMKELRKKVVACAVELHKAEVDPSDSLATVIEDGNLKVLTNAEIAYFELNKEIIDIPVSIITLCLSSILKSVLI